MAFSYTHDATVPMGNKRAALGTYNCDSVTGGDISTGLRVVESFILSTVGSAIGTGDPASNETFPLVDTAVTIVTTSGDTGFWMAIGV